jgi:hypothetical protein
MNSTTDMGSELTLDQLVNNPFDDNRTGIQRFNNEEDSRLHVRFYMEPLEQTARSIKEGRRIFEDTEFIEIMIPGDKLNIIKRQVFDIDKQRFAQQYARFRQGLADQTVGTPLTELVFITAAKVKEYEYFGIKTVEQLAGCADGSDAGQRMMGFQGDKQKAAGFLQAAKGQAPFNELSAKLENSEATIENLSRQLAEMNARLDAQQAKGSKKAAE